MGLRVAKAHAYGNDFLLCASGLAPSPRDLPDAVRRLCDRHRGIGADGLIVYALRPAAATMQIFNADGGEAELSGNGLRCLAALVARDQQLAPGAHVSIDSGAGRKTLELLDGRGTRFTFRAAMGEPENLRRIDIPVEGEIVTASVLRMGNPQCIILGPLPDPARFNRLGPALAAHELFPAGTNVEFAHVESPDRVRILIWERGVGPTSSSGTGTAASAVAAAAHGGAARVLEVVAPGGAQRVEWLDDGVYLTGWAEMVFDGEWGSGL